jgi:hypothetical protein
MLGKVLRAGLVGFQGIRAVKHYQSIIRERPVLWKSEKWISRVCELYDKRRLFSVRVQRPAACSSISHARTAGAGAMADAAGIGPRFCRPAKTAAGTPTPEFHVSGWVVGIERDPFTNRPSARREDIPGFCMSGKSGAGRCRAPGYAVLKRMQFPCSI